MRGVCHPHVDTAPRIVRRGPAQRRRTALAAAAAAAAAAGAGPTAAAAAAAGCERRLEEVTWLGVRG